MTGTVPVGSLSSVSNRPRRRPQRRNSPKSAPSSARKSPTAEKARRADEGLAAIRAHEPEDGPTPLRVAVLVLWGEAALLVVLGLIELYKLATGSPTNVVMAITLALAPIAAGLLLAQLGRSIVGRRSWARSPAIVLQLMALPVAFFMISGEGGPMTRIGGVLIGVVALCCAGLLLVPSSRAALTPR